jgi:hypothetical protein
MIYRESHEKKDTIKDPKQEEKDIRRRDTCINKETGEADKPVIYTFLRHHYILRRSIVVITDEKFSSFFFYEQAIKIIQDLMHKLNPTDYFGCIQMKRSVDFNNILLEEV